MDNSIGRLIMRMQASGEAATKKAYATYISMLHAERETAREYIRSLGYVEIDIEESEMIYTEDAVYLPDGRVAMKAQGRMWACDATAYKKRRDDFFAQMKASHGEAQAFETKSIVGTESLSTIACPKCGDALQHTVVCPKCAAGKLGYRHRYTCVCGGVDLISKDKL